VGEQVLENLLTECAPDGGRTHNLWLRRPTLYPLSYRRKASKIRSFRPKSQNQHRIAEGIEPIPFPDGMRVDAVKLLYPGQ